MKVAHVLSHVSEIHAGVPIATRKLGHALVKLGVDVSFWTTGRPEDARMFDGTGIHANVFPRKWLQGWRYSPDLARHLARRINEFDVVHIHEAWSYPQLIAARLAHRSGVPYVWAPRASLEPWRMRHKGWKKHWYFKCFGTRIMSRARCMHAVSEAETAGFRALGYRGPCFVVNNGIDVDEFRTLPSAAEAEQLWPALAGRQVVLFLSRISPEKGLDQLLPAWREVLDTGASTGALLVLAGPDDRGYRGVVERLVHRWGLNSAVFLPGMVSGRKKLALLSRADVYVLPSYSEGFSNSILESLAAATPVLITPGCNFPEVTSAGAGLCVDAVSGALAGGLRHLLGLSPDERLAMGRRGRQLVHASYTWESAARELATVYDAIVCGGVVPERPVPIPIDSNGAASFHPACQAGPADRPGQGRLTEQG